jgi:DNA-binding NarL/FixJ family response regulator
VLKSDAGRDLVTAVEALCRLTAREREIVQLLAGGKSNKEVASSLNISIKTAETHRTTLCGAEQHRRTVMGGGTGLQPFVTIG